MDMQLFVHKENIEKLSSMSCTQFIESLQYLISHDTVEGTVDSDADFARGPLHGVYLQSFPTRTQVLPAISHVLTTLLPLTLLLGPVVMEAGSDT
jgi:hypothetical protein